jgi:hypothetical protein
MTTTDTLAHHLLAAANYIDTLGGVSQPYRHALAAFEAQAEAEAKPAPEPAYTYERQKTAFEVWAERIGLRLDRWRIHPEFCDQAEAETWAAWQAWKDSPGQLFRVT